MLTKSKRQSHGRCQARRRRRFRSTRCWALPKGSRRSHGKAARSRSSGRHPRRPSRCRRPGGTCAGRGQAGAHSPLRHAGAHGGRRRHPSASRSRHRGFGRRSAPVDDGGGARGHRGSRGGRAQAASPIQCRVFATRRCKPGVARFRKRRVSRSSPRVSDANPHVALLAIDLLGNGCPAGGGSPLNQIASADSGRARAHGIARHMPLVALAKSSPADARPLLARYAGHPIWQVRMYAAHAAGFVSDVETLSRLGHDTHRQRARGGA